MKELPLMTKYIIRNRIVLAMLTIWLVFTLTIFISCKKKEQPEDTQQAVPTEKTKHVSASEKIDKTDVSEKIDLRILYVGHPDSSREKDFVNFLTKQFKAVETADLKDFNEGQTDGFDVTILDYDGDGFKSPRPNISRNFSRPMVTVGVTGALMSSRWNLKTGYL
jgi:hypothetical protein